MSTTMTVCEDHGFDDCLICELQSELAALRFSAEQHRKEEMYWREQAGKLAEDNARLREALGSLAEDCKCYQWSEDDCGLCTRVIRALKGTV